MNILVTGANGQLGNEMRIIAKHSADNYIFTDVNQIEGVETTYLDITDLEAIRKMVSENNVDVIVNCAAWTNVDACETDEKLAALAEKLNADAPENLAKAIEVIIEDYKKENSSSEYSNTGIYHFSNEGVCSWFDFTKMIAEYSGHNECEINPCYSAEYSSPVKRPAYSVLDKSKIKETFGVKVPYWTDSLKICINNLQN